MKVIITGATGMVGKGVLLECLEHADVSEALSISRKTTAIDHPKFRELIHTDFSEFASVSDRLRGYDAYYACMGVSSAGVKEEEYTRLTHDFTLALVRELYRLNPDLTFTYVSGQGTDSSEKGGSMWARVKGKTENDLLKMGLRQAYAFRPGMIIPKKGVEPSSRLYRAIIMNLGWLLKLIKKMAPNSVVDSVQIGKAMITITEKGYGKSIIDLQDIQVLAEQVWMKGMKKNNSSVSFSPLLQPMGKNNYYELPQNPDYHFSPDVLSLPSGPRSVRANCY